MNGQFVMIEGVVGCNAQGFSVHRHPAYDGQDRYFAYIGLRDDARLIWQEIEMSQEQIGQIDKVLAGGNKVRVSGLLKKQLGAPLCRVQVDGVELIKAAQATAHRKAA
jgi:hypothetical protein